MINPARAALSFGRIPSSEGNPQSEQRPASRAIRDFDRATVRFRNFGNDRKAETSALSDGAPTAPEALEDALPIRFRDAGTTIGNGDDPAFRYGDRYLASRRGLVYRILNQITHRVRDRVCASVDLDRSGRCIEAEQARLTESPRRHRFQNRGGSCNEIDLCGDVHGNAV